MDTGNHPDPLTDAMGHGLHWAMQVGAPDDKHGGLRAGHDGA
jgi:hypothetical protein